MSSEKEILKIKNLLLTQDNRITDAPIFVVEQKIRDYGFADGYEDDWAWVKYNWGDQSSVDNSRLIERLNRIWHHGDRDCLKRKYSRIGYRDRWVFVTCCFTEQGCKDYLAIDRHNLGREVRIFAHGSYRNFEYRTVREFLMTYKETT